MPTPEIGSCGSWGRRAAAAGVRGPQPGAEPMTGLSRDAGLPCPASSRVRLAAPRPHRASQALAQQSVSGLPAHWSLPRSALGADVEMPQTS